MLERERDNHVIEVKSGRKHEHSFIPYDNDKLIVHRALKAKNGIKGVDLISPRTIEEILNTRFRSCHDSLHKGETTKNSVLPAGVDASDAFEAKLKQVGKVIGCQRVRGKKKVNNK